MQEGVARVRYFKGPSTDPYVVREVVDEDVSTARLRRHTRVYFHDGNRWRIGRIDAEQADEDGRFVVAMPNGYGQVLGAESFDVRWNLPISDPFELLAVGGGDSPVVYEPRVDLISSWYEQRAAAAGVEGLLLASVELHAHQLSVVRSVSNDAVRRYLLADEVGLGKTIEAGALVWQELRANSSASVLVLAPEHLRQQWAEELVDKFHLGEFNDAQIRVRSHGDHDSWPTEPVDVLVVDEAHHLTRAGRSQEHVLRQLASLAHSSSQVFLLTATPVRSNEAAFLDLLHLLDPTNYRLDDLESFARRVELRDELALVHIGLSPDLDEFDLSLFSEQLRSMFPEDEQLLAHLERAANSSNGERPGQIELVKNHLSETYRLHHRLLRTRRTAETHESFGVRGRRRGRPFTVELADASDELREDLIESFRLHLAERIESGELEVGSAVAAFRTMCEWCCSLPTALLTVDGLGGGQGSGGDEAARWLQSLGGGWRRDLEALEPVQMDAAVRQVGEMAISRNLGKVIVSTGYTSVAKDFADAVEAKYGAHRVARHLDGQTSDQNSTNAEHWRSQEECRLFVCDASAEEGVNLQDADAIVHLDLPWEVFRLEQRIGRADRHARGERRPVASMVFVYGEQSYGMGWFLFAADSCGVFDRSVSSLQYVLADVESELLAKVIVEGVAVFDSDVEVRHDQLAAEGHRIAAHDSLDSAKGEHERLNQRLLELESHSTNDGALVDWLRGVGAKIARPSRGSIRIAGRPRLQVPFELEAAMAPWMNQELTVDRSAAVERQLPLVRAGHGLFDEIVRHLESDDRGVAFAFSRHVKNHWPPTVVLRTDFVVRVEVPQSASSVAESVGLGHWLVSECRSYAPPLLETVFMSVGGEEIDSRSVLAYDRSLGDQNLGSRPELFESLIRHLNWEEVCQDGLARAQRILERRASVASSRRVADHIRASTGRRLSVLSARQSSGVEGVEEQVAALGAVRAALTRDFDLDIDVVGCGAVIFADIDVASAGKSE
ncbi:ATP-dependent helicase HepA [Ilumatobacter fluminis]|uniref:ATP-dependent helicase HepA n=2 Tax=Ilumatobacter fluminis TaxID=467091 RepID=A0A4R7HUI9_9ACTN|nr:ATP-dependent helicase HepA [Ilumatobacter fluminis]